MCCFTGIKQAEQSRTLYLIQPALCALITPIQTKERPVEIIATGQYDIVNNTRAGYQRQAYSMTLLTAHLQVIR
jgi:hypothetical protein